MKKIGLIVICLFLFNSFHARAEETLVFGPITYIRTTGQPDVFIADFSALQGEGRVLIRNGDEFGENTVSSGRVIIGNQLVASEDDFKKEVKEIERKIDLLEINEVNIKLAGKPGSQITIEVYGSAPEPSKHSIYYAGPTQIAVINAQTLEVERYIDKPAGVGNLGEVSYVIGGRTIYISTHSPSGLISFDLQTEIFGAWISTPSATYLRQPMVTPDQKLAFIVDEYGSLYVVDLVAGEQVNVIGMPGFNFYGDISPDGSRVYIPHRNAGYFSIVDTATQTIVDNITTQFGTHGIRITADGIWALVVNEYSNSLSKVHLPTRSVQNMGVGSHPMGPWLSKDGQRWYFACRDSDQVWVLNPDTLEVLAMISVPASQPNSTYESKDGLLFVRAYINNQGRLFVFDVKNNWQYIKTFDLPWEAPNASSLFEAP